MLQYRMGAEEPLRLPDADNSPSAATVLRSEYTVTSDGAGHVVFGEYFHTIGAKQAWTVTAGSTGTNTGTNHPQHAAFAAEARYFRMVGMKIQVTYIGAEQTSAGFLSYVEKSSITDCNTQTVDSLHTGSSIQVAAKEGLIAFVDYTQLPRWELPSTSNAMEATFPMALFAASGLPFSTAVFRVRVARFLEFIPVEGALSEGELRHEPSNPGSLAAHGELSGPKTSVYTPAQQSTFMKEVRRIANAAYHMVQPLAPYVVPAARAFLSTNFASAAAGKMAALAL